MNRIFTKQIQYVKREVPTKFVSIFYFVPTYTQHQVRGINKETRNIGTAGTPLERLKTAPRALIYIYVPLFQ